MDWLVTDEDEVIALPAGAILFQAGDAGDRLYIFLEGRADIVLVDGQVIESAGPGAIVGELAVIDKATRSATVVCRTSCRLLSINEDRFRELIRRDPDFAIAVMRVVVNRLRRMNRRMTAYTARTYAALSEIV